MSVKTDPYKYISSSGDVSLNSGSILYTTDSMINTSISGSVSVTNYGHMDHTKIADLGVSKTVTLTSGDLLSRCPGCWGNSVSSIGTLSIDGNAREVTKCDSCNRIYSRTDGGIRSLVEEAQQTFQTPNVGFTPTITTAGTQQGSWSTSTITTQDYQSQHKLQNIDDKLQNLVNIVEELSQYIGQMARQNTELMEKLATDPLVDIRKKVSKFDLK